MAKKEFTFRGMTLDEAKKLSLKEFMKHVPSRSRRSLERGFTDAQKILLEQLKTGKNSVKTHCRDMVIIPEMIDRKIKVHNGKQFVEVLIQAEMLGHVLGEFSLTRGGVKHSAPGVGATRSSTGVSVK
ncbi:MAG: 30S ribosomal protein S19 [Nanoarchaeota archaeon]